MANNNVVESLEIDVTLKDNGYKERIKELESMNNDLEESLVGLDKKHGDLQKAHDKTTKTLDTVVKGLGRFFGALAVATGLEKLVNDVASANDQLGFLEKQLNLNANTIRNWQGAIAAGGGSAQGLTNSFKTLTNGINNFVLKGDASLTPYLSALGVNMYDTQGHIKKTDDLMLDLADSFSKMNSSQAYSIGKDMGFDEGTIGALIQGRDALKDSLAYQNQLYKSSQEDIKNSRELQKNRALLNAQWESFKTMLGNQILPIFNRFASAVLHLFETMQRHQDTVKVVFGGLAVLMSASIIPLFTRALAPLLAFIGPFAPFAVVIAGLAAAFLGLYDDYETWARGGKSLFDWGQLKKFMDDNTFSAKNLGDGFKEIGSQLRDQAIPTLKEYKEILGDLLNGDFTKAKDKAVKMVSNFSDNAFNVLGKWTGEKPEDLQGFLGEAMYKITHYGKDYNEYNNVKTPTATPVRRSGTFNNQIGGFIKEASQKYGIDEKTLRGFVQMEGGYNGAISSTGATGVGQFTQTTWNSLSKTREGQEIGMTVIDSRNKGTANDPRKNNYINTMATALLAKQNADLLKRNGLPVTGENLYLMHNMGGSLIPAMKGSDQLQGSLRHNIDVNGGKGMSPTEFVKYQRGRFNASYGIANMQQAITPTMPQSANHNTTNTNNVTVSMPNLTVYTAASTLSGVTADIMKQNSGQYTSLIGVLK